MKIKNLIKLYFTLIIIFSVNVIFSQQTYYFFTPQNTNDQVIDFFNKKQFSILKQQTKIIPDKSYPTEAEYVITRHIVHICCIMMMLFRYY